MSSIIVIDGVQKGLRFQLTKRPLSVGRDAARDIQITDPKVSRKHALIRYEGGGHVIAPVEAKNGIKVNDAPIAESSKLSDGDQIKLGDTLLKYVDVDESGLGDGVNELKAATRNDQTLIG